MKTTIDFRDENGEIVEKDVELRGRKLHILRGEVKAGPIELTDTGRDETGWYQILAVSDDCLHFGPEHVGKWVYLPDNPFNVGMSYRVGVGERIIREKWFEAVSGPPMAVFEESA